MTDEELKHMTRAIIEISERVRRLESRKLRLKVHRVQGKRPRPVEKPVAVFVPPNPGVREKERAAGMDFSGENLNLPAWK